MDLPQDLKAQFDNVISQHTDVVISGLTDFSIYRESVGVIIGLKQALALIEQYDPKE